MKQQEEDDDDAPTARYEPATELLLEMASSPPTKRRRRPDVNMGYFHLIIHGVMRCLQKLKTICGNTIERRGHRRQAYHTEEEENIPLLTDNDVQAEDYPSADDNDTPEQVTALDQAMASFVETNNPEALMHVFDVAIKDDKQD